MSPIRDSPIKAMLVCNSRFIVLSTADPSLALRRDAWGLLGAGRSSCANSQHPCYY
jgi:hypothetical protein